MSLTLNLGVGGLAGHVTHTLILGGGLAGHVTHTLILGGGWLVMSLIH